MIWDYGVFANTAAADYLDSFLPAIELSLRKDIDDDEALQEEIVYGGTILSRIYILTKFSDGYKLQITHQEWARWKNRYIQFFAHYTMKKNYHDEDMTETLRYVTGFEYRRARYGVIQRVFDSLEKIIIDVESDTAGG